MKLREGLTQPGVVGTDFIKDDIESTNGISTCGKEKKCGKFPGKPYSEIRSFRSWWSLIELAMSKDKPTQSHCSMLTARMYFPIRLGWAEQHWSEAWGPLPCIPLASLKWMQVKFKFLLWYCGEHPSHRELVSPIHPQPRLNSDKGKYIPNRYINAFSTKKARKDSQKWKKKNPNIPNSLIFLRNVVYGTLLNLHYSLNMLRLLHL